MLTCASCGAGCLATYPGGICRKCHARRLDVAGKIIQRLKSGGALKPSPCSWCGGEKLPKAGESQSEYNRRKHCAKPRTCFSEAQSAFTAKVKAGAK